MGTLVCAFNSAAVLLGSIKSAKKAAASRENGKRGGYWQQKRNHGKLPYGLNRQYERHIDVNSLVDNPQNATQSM